MLRSWELDLELDHNRRVDFCLVASFNHPPGPLAAAGQVKVSGTAATSLIVGGPLPVPTASYYLGPLTSKYMQRLRDLREGRDKVPGTAYFVLTDLETTQGGLAGVATGLGVSRSVLVRLRQLASGSHPTQARKSAPGGTALSEADLYWLRRATEVLVRRTAQMEAGTLPQVGVTMGDV
jgi:hypothetical protein